MSEALETIVLFRIEQRYNLQPPSRIPSKTTKKRQVIHLVFIAICFRVYQRGGKCHQCPSVRISSTFVYTNHLPIKQLLRQEAYVDTYSPISKLTRSWSILNEATYNMMEMQRQRNDQCWLQPNVIMNSGMKDRLKRGTQFIYCSFFTRGRMLGG